MNTIHYPDPHSHIVIEIAEKDFPTKMKWSEAKKACADLGEGWRLPTFNELQWIYKFKNTIGGFTFDSYWSLTEYTIDAMNNREIIGEPLPLQEEHNYTSAGKVDFRNGKPGTYFKSERFDVRAVRRTYMEQ